MKINPVAVIALAISSSALGSTDPAAVAKADELLRASELKLSSAHSLKAVYTETDEYPGQYRDLRQIGTLTLSKPGEIRLRIVRARRVKAGDPWKDSGNTTLRVSDGSSETFAFFHPESTQVRTEPASNKLEEAPLLQAFLGQGRAPASAFDTAQRDDELSDVEVNGNEVRFKTGDLDRTLEIGPDGLIHSLSVKNDKSGAVKTWTLDSITLNPTLSASEFRYTAPKEALPFANAERSTGIPVGDSAADFQVAGKDGKPVRLADYKGKVVVLEFWATWCWPCNQSIPETQRLVEKFRDCGADSLLVSIKDNRKGFDAWIKKHPQYGDLNFAFDDPVRGQAYEAFLHPQNPTLYVIGRDGRVVYKTEGYTGPNPAVESAIQSALAAK